MRTKLVTAFYTNIIGHPFYGHESYSRHERYLHSLRTLNNLNTEIVCYCNQEQHNTLTEHCEKFNLNNIQIKVSNLSDFPHSERMKQIKESTNQFKFYHEVDWNKFYLLEKEYDESYDYLYWIDVGISHRGLFLEKYNPNADKIDGLSRTYENYSFTNLFQPILFNKINSWVGDKLINLANRQISHNPSELNDVMDTQKIYNKMSIGGFIGGKIDKIKWLLQEFSQVSSYVLNKSKILNHEAMMSHIVENNNDNFKTYEFDTWYHDDFWKTTPVFDNESIKNKIHFVHFFEKELKI